MTSAKKCEIHNVNVHSKKCFDVFSGIGKKLSIKYKGKHYKKKNNTKELAKQHESTSKTIIRNLFT